MGGAIRTVQPALGRPPTGLLLSGIPVHDPVARGLSRRAGVHLRALRCRGLPHGGVRVPCGLRPLSHVDPLEWAAALEPPCGTSPPAVGQLRHVEVAQLVRCEEHELDSPGPQARGESYQQIAAVAAEAP